jgi:hypothetical protein
MGVASPKRGGTTRHPLAWQKHLFGLRGGVATETETS